MSFNTKPEFDSRGLEGSAADRRAAAQREEQDRLATRQKYLAALTSPLHEPLRRIRLWEQLHAMHLPRDGAHRLVGVIAAQTALTIEQVQDEQSRRAAERTAIAPEPTA